MEAISMAAFIMSSLLAKTLDTRPHFSASSLFIFLAVRQRSLTSDWLPSTLGNLSSQSHVHLLHAEPGVLCAQSDIYSCYQVYPCTNTSIVNTADHWLPALLYQRELILQVPDVLVHCHGLPGYVIIAVYDTCQLAQI